MTDITKSKVYSRFSQLVTSNYLQMSAIGAAVLGATSLAWWFRPKTA